MGASGYIKRARSALPGPRSKVAKRASNPSPPPNPPAKNQSKMVSIRFNQEELSRRAKGSKILRRP